jgi:hypothetical protein
MTIDDVQLAKFAVAVTAAILSTRTDAQAKGNCSDCGVPLERSDYQDAGFIVTKAFATYDLTAQLKWWKENITDDEGEQPISTEPLQVGSGNVKLVM